MQNPGDLSQDRLLETLPRDRKGLPVLGGVSIVRRLGAGGMGAVYKGMDRNGRAVAVKILPFTLLEQNPGLEKRFLIEARTAAAIDSPNVVQVYDANCEHRTHFIVMEYVAGDSLGGFVRKSGALDEAMALRLAIAGAKGLAAAHAKGIVHRDVKPENFLIPDGNPDGTKLADLGLAKPEGGGQSFGTLSHVTMGTPGYMAPEQALNARDATAAADVFAMGATIHMMFTGRAPFSGDSLIEVLKSTAGSNAAPLPDGVSAGMKWVVDRCLAKKPWDRFKDGAELLAALERVASDPQATGPRPAKFARPAPSGDHSIELAATPAPRRSATVVPVVISAVALLLAVGLVAWLKIRGDSKKKETVEGATIAEDRVLPLLEQADRLADQGRLEDALATLSKAAAESPDDPRIRAVRVRIEGKAATSRSAAEKSDAFRRFRTAVDAARLSAEASDTPKDWSLVAEAAAGMEANAQTPEEHDEAAARIAMAAQRRGWAEAQARQKNGDLEGAATEGQKALDAGPPNEALEMWLVTLRGQISRQNETARRKRAFDDFAQQALAANDADPGRARELWAKALLSADAPADADRARKAYDALTLTIEGADAARKFDTAVRSVADAIDQDRLDDAVRLLADARALRASDPRLDAVAKRLETARSQKAYDAAMKEAAEAQGVGKKREALERALAARPGDAKATEEISKLKASVAPIKVSVKGKRLTLALDDATELAFMKIQPGTFQMGSGLERKVKLTAEFAIGVTEVTQEQWFAVMGTNPSTHKGPRYPVETITFRDALQFCAALDARLEGWTCSLPSEAQWEYACRAGTKTKWSFGDDLKDLSQYAWTGDANGQSHEVAKLKPNPWELYDMHGNVWEWTVDCGPGLADKEATNPVSLAPSNERITRGGDWNDPGHTQSAGRHGQQLFDAVRAIGLRIILVEGKQGNPHLQRHRLFTDAARKIPMEFVRIEPAKFMMGEADIKGATVHEVTLTKPFWIQTTEVTQAQWQAVMGKRDFKTPGPDLPADEISWDEADKFAREMTRKHNLRISLPTEAEWEYACRAGTSSPWYSGDDAKSAAAIGWYNGNAKSIQPVRRLEPNFFGLYDMSGNVWEWCADWSAELNDQPAIDPRGPKDGKMRVMRGGCVGDTMHAMQSCLRAEFDLRARPGLIGVRLVFHER